MERIEGKRAVVTGGSRGLGKGIVKALAARGAEVWAVARNADKLAVLERDVPGVKTLALDVAADDAPSQVFDAVTPDVLVLNAGASPHMAPLHQQSWEQFNLVWNNDVKSTFNFGKAAILAPLPRGSEVLVVSSGAALSGSFASGGYAGAKRTQWFIADYLQREADELDLGITFRTVLPKQMFAGTELGNQGSSGYAARLGISQQKFLERFKDPLSPDDFGETAVALLADPAYADGHGFAVSGAGVETLG